LQHQKIQEKKIKELDETMENLDLGDQLEDFMICYDDTSDKSADTWKTELELHEDKETILSNSSSKFDNRYQVLAIIGDNSEELDDNNNPVLNPANINRGANHLAEGDTAELWQTGIKFDYHSRSGTQSKQPWSTACLYQRMQAKTIF
jgi:hypothetical protein